ncbi:MAG: hypothetical protein ACHREM_15190, partial [Polyangiales bacterium]
IAAFDDGLPGAIAPERTIVDLSGLHDRRISLDGWTPARIVATERPDVVYLLPPAWHRWNDELLRAPIFAEYERFSARARGYSFDVAVRRDSRCRDAARAILGGVLARALDANSPITP